MIWVGIAIGVLGTFAVEATLLIATYVIYRKGRIT